MPSDAGGVRMTEAVCLTVVLRRRRFQPMCCLSERLEGRLVRNGVSP